MLRFDKALVRLTAMACGLLASAWAPHADAKPLSPAARAIAASGKNLYVVVEYRVGTVDAAADAERARRGLRHDDAAILAQRARGYAAVKRRVDLADGGAHAARVLDYPHLSLALWRVSSTAALQRLESDADVHLVHENLLLHPVSVSDLPFIDQPQAAAEGATGAGTTVAVIDGGLGSNYLDFTDFGTCTAVNTPAATCRVVYNQDFYPGQSTETVHGTNVSAIALGVAPGAKLAMFDVFNGTQASSADVLSAMDTSIANQSAENIVAINLSLGDGTSNASQCADSVFGPAVTSAASAGMMTVAAAGNSGSKSGLGDPACAPGVVSVGAVYSASYGTLGWEASAASGGVCYDASAPDLVTCFSQSASYLSLLAPGSFVNAPSSAFQQSGTSQATPHVSGAIAVLRARYPAEPPAETLQRLQASDVRDTDPADGLTTPRLDLLNAVNQGAAIALSATGPTQGMVGQTSTYTLTAASSGPLTAYGVKITDVLPASASFVSASAGCTLAGSTVTCLVGSLASGGKVSVSINVKWNASGAVYDAASVSADEIDTAPTAEQNAGLGTPPAGVTDGPMPLWAQLALAAGVMAIGQRRLRLRRVLG